MADHAPDQLPAFAFGGSISGLRLMPRPQSQPQARPEAAQQQLRKRKSLLSMTLDHILPSRPSPNEPTSAYRCTASQCSSSFEDTSQRYRCDIFATSSSDHAAAEAECKQLVLEAGGRVVEQQYPGGFLFDVPDLAVLPIETGDETVGGGSIVVEPMDRELHEQHIRTLRRLAQDPIPAMKKWTIKSEHRLHKRTRNGRISPFQALKDDREPLFATRRNCRVTLMELLLEELEQRLKLEAGWETEEGDG